VYKKDKERLKYESIEYMYRIGEDRSAFFGEVFKSLRLLNLSKQLMYNF
jgi:hypothetical protein